MGLPIDANPSPYRILEQPYPFIELARQQIIHVDDLTQVSVQEGAVPGLYQVVLQKR